MSTMQERRFNLVDEPWIPVAGAGLVSLRQIFSDNSLSVFGGSPIEKISVTRLLLAIAQSAYTPADDDEWFKMGAIGMGKKAVGYLEVKKDSFWLFGEMPFLQVKNLRNYSGQIGD